ncbi:pyridoxal phosphate-dependent decarboxylase family protein [Blastococcus xanthinilyticus]|uniref:Glutamate/tyrosine decarboxylase-like PLP-dependent enzyme n=1 Tax=Blastococcus xanthinilyticus TaxID=1564164 RepID=A0A5S5D4G5_9ACTN|nr:aspartate aminotransferase family protein [Blastococcus xanthinilyticus]TYP89579.1 glutamate/tyrosine decarboxylase-like PLP-dependent enzyme [Blastococcus xanthinilyticus]
MAAFPASGTDASEVLGRIEQLQHEDIGWRDGRAFAYVYHAGEALEELLQDAYLAGFSTNGLSPAAFPSLGRMERDVLEMVGDLLGCPAPAGSMTSGGSESILLAVKTARDALLASRPEVARPRVVLPVSAHPAFSKAAHLLGMTTTRVPVDPAGLRADPERMHRAVADDTALLVASAPSYPHGVVDPVADLAAVAGDHDVPLHVDACVGGMLLPFVRDLGRPVPAFDFTVAGVSSMSVDLHKFGYAAKGASLVLYRDPSYFAHQPFVFDDWSGGHYAAPNVAGTRPGGAIAAAWAALTHLGRKGYQDLTRRALAATDEIRAGIERIPGLQVLGAPDASLLAFGSAGPSLPAIVKDMRRRGWAMGLQGPPESIHLTVTAGHERVVDALLADLRSACSAEDTAPAERAPGYT